MYKTLIASVALLGLLVAVPAIAKKQAKPSKSGILQPQMTVAADAGSYEKPMGTIGTKPAAVWTDTTVAAGVDKKPLDGKAVTMVGEIVDLSCYMQLGKHGEKHVACGKKCIAAGQPAGLLAKDGTVFMLMAEEHDPRRDGKAESFRQTMENHLGHIMEVSGTETMVRGYRAIYVQGYVK